MVILSQLLREKEYNVVNYSDKNNKLLRLVDMCFGLIKHKDSDYLLIDTYSTFNFYYAFFTSQLSRLFNLKYIPILHGGNLPQRLKKSPLFSEMIFKYAYINVAPSRYLLEAFQNLKYKTILIPNALDLKLYPFKERNIVQPKLFWVRAFDEIYNPLLAVKILHLLKKEYPNAILCMVGGVKDDSFDEVKEYIKKNNLNDSVELAGYMNKEDWIKKSEEFDIFINTTNFDNTPVSVIEAMALGLPIISTNVGGLPFLIENNKTGILVELNNSEAFVENIIDLISNSEKAQNLAKSARTEVEKFDWNAVSNLWKKILS